LAGRGDSSEIAPVYLFAGTDEAKIDTTVTRLRKRAEAEGGPGALEAFAAGSGGAGPDAEALAASIPALSLIASQRYLLADGVERWSAKQAEPVIAALATLPPQTTVVLIAREDPPKVRAPKKLIAAVESAGGEVFNYQAPKARELPRWLRDEAQRRGFTLDDDAAALLVDRLGEGTTRLATELDRLALWAEPGGAVTREDLDEMIADTSEEVSWALSDAVVDRDPGGALAAAERLTDQGEAVTPLVYGVAKRLREASAALERLEAGMSPKDVESSLSMHPYAAKLLVRRVRNRSLGEIRAATCAVADLEWWTRGGSDYPEPVALTLAVRRAAGGG
jgi:DNA polymerase-3 subunit delta